MQSAKIVAIGLIWIVGLATNTVSTAQTTTATVEQMFAASLTELPTQALSVTGSIYIPVYSSVSFVPGRLKADFSITLSIHNASRDKPLVLKRVGYFDTAGQLVQNYLQHPIALKPFGTVEIFIPQKDVRGGTGANFVVDWASAGQMSEPVAEALMFGSIAGGFYAFISQGRHMRLVGSTE